MSIQKITKITKHIQKITKNEAPASIGGTESEPGGTKLEPGGSKSEPGAPKREARGCPGETKKNELWDTVNLIQGFILKHQHQNLAKIAPRRSQMEPLASKMAAWGPGWCPKAGRDEFRSLGETPNRDHGPGSGILPV